GTLTQNRLVLADVLTTEDGTPASHGPGRLAALGDAARADEEAWARGRCGRRSTRGGRPAAGRSPGRSAGRSPRRSTRPAATAGCSRRTSSGPIRRPTTPRWRAPRGRGAARAP